MSLVGPGFINKKNVKQTCSHHIKYVGPLNGCLALFDEHFWDTSMNTQQKSCSETQNLKPEKTVSNLGTQPRSLFWQRWKNILDSTKLEHWIQSQNVLLFKSGFVWNKRLEWQVQDGNQMVWLLNPASA